MISKRNFNFQFANQLFLPSIVHENGLTGIKGHASAAMVSGSVDAPNWVVIVHCENPVCPVETFDVDASLKDGHSMYMTHHVQVLRYLDNTSVWFWHFGVFKHFINISSNKSFCFSYTKKTKQYFCNLRMTAHVVSILLLLFFGKSILSCKK